MTELLKEKWVKIEDLGKLGDLGGIRLSTIFEEVTARYEQQKGGRLIHWGRQEAPSRFVSKDVIDFRAVLDRQNLTELAAVEENVFRIKDEDGLTIIFRAGRLLDDQCLASRRTAQYLLLKSIVNDVLVERGIVGLHIY